MFRILKSGLERRFVEEVAEGAEALVVGRRRGRLRRIVAVAGVSANAVVSADFRLELRGVVVRGLDRESDAAIVLVDFDDAGGNFLSDFEHVFDFFDVVFTDLGDVDESVDGVFEFDERAERRDFRNFTGNDVADVEFAIHVRPR